MSPIHPGFTNVRDYKRHKSPLRPMNTPAYDLGSYGTTLASGLLNATSGIPSLVTAVLPVFALLVGIAMLPRVARKFGIKR